jgi:hypothetical protein
MHADLGYDPHNLLSVSLAVREGAHPAWGDRAAYFEQIRRTIEAAPDVLSAAIKEGSLPPSNFDSTPISIPGMNTAGREVEPERVSAEYFAALRTPLLHGRAWSAPEMAHAAHLALINQAMQRRYWPNRDPIGQTIVLNHGVAAVNVWTLVAPGNDQHFQIIGVVADTPNRSLEEQVAPAVYVPYTAIMHDWFNLVLRTRASATAGLLHRIKQQVHAIDAGQAVGDMVTAEDLLQGDMGRDRFVASLFTAFAFLGLAFAVSGLYCIQSFLVTQRTREFGVRIALGARREHIVSLVTRSSIAGGACRDGDWPCFGYSAEPDFLPLDERKLARPGDARYRGRCPADRCGVGLNRARAAGGFDRTHGGPKRGIAGRYLLRRLDMVRLYIDGVCKRKCLHTPVQFLAFNICASGPWKHRRRGPTRALQHGGDPRLWRRGPACRSDSLHVRAPFHGWIQ